MKFLASRILPTLAFALVLVFASISSANSGTTDVAETATTGASESKVGEESYQGYLLSTPQIQDPLKPLAYATAAFNQFIELTMGITRDIQPRTANHGYRH
jgi:hypothetical protein